MAAICALESRSLEFMREKLAKRKLEERIQELTSQMLTVSLTKAMSKWSSHICSGWRERPRYAAVS